MIAGRRISSILLCAVSAGPAISGTTPIFDVEDYFNVRRVVETTMSSDGEALAFLVESASLSADVTMRTAYIVDLRGNLALRELSPLQDGTALSFIPHSHTLAFLATRSGKSQLWSFDPQTGITRRLTDTDESVTRFRFAPDGVSYAYTTTLPQSGAGGLSAQLRSGDAGVIVDSQTASFFDFVSEHSGEQPASHSYLRLSVRGRPAPSAIPIPGDTQNFFWSADGKYLSINYVADGVPPSQLRDLITSIGVFDVTHRTFWTLAQGHPPTAQRNGRIFEGGEWLGQEHKILLRKIDESDPWASLQFPSWRMTDIFWRIPEESWKWRPAERYPLATFFPLSSDTLLVENTQRGDHALYEWRGTHIARSDWTRGWPGRSSHVAFDATMHSVAFVGEDLTAPPEVYVRLQPSAPLLQVTRLNADVRSHLTISARRVTWSSNDGQQVQGYLLEPPRDQSTARPWPLVTFIHGGPCFAFDNGFAPYFDRWPYPFEALASHGIAVFIPNYRGTCSYGRRFNAPAALDKEPIEDILSGIRSLITEGVADPKRLGLAGHSHGAWLGPLLMTRAKDFAAGSFAEGTSNLVASYELLPGMLNSEVNDVTTGGSLYDVPSRYLELSPDLHFAGVATASLFEAGAESQAILMLGYAKAARRFGIPAETVIYPRMMHNLSSPRAQFESASRNLQWFSFWLKDEVPATAGRTTGEHERWRQLRNQALSRRAQVNLSPPSQPHLNIELGDQVRDR